MSAIDDLLKLLNANPILQEFVVKPAAEALAKHKALVDAMNQPDINRELVLLDPQPAALVQAAAELLKQRERERRHTQILKGSLPRHLIPSPRFEKTAEELLEYRTSALRDLSNRAMDELTNAMDRKFFEAVAPSPEILARLEKDQARRKEEAEAKRLEAEEVAKLCYPDLSNI